MSETPKQKVRKILDTTSLDEELKQLFDEALVQLPEDFVLGMYEKLRDEHSAESGKDLLDEED